MLKITFKIQERRVESLLTRMLENLLMSCKEV